MKVFIDKTLTCFSPLQYIWNVFSFNQNIETVFVENQSDAEFIISEGEESDLPLAKDFYNRILNRQFEFKNYFKKDCLITTGSGKPDYLATAFYMINSLQEYDANDKDEIGRFPYSASYQFRFGNVTENLVQQYFDKLKNEHPKLSSLKKTYSPTKIFLSHDIDTVHGALLQDGAYVLKRGDIAAFFQLAFHAVIRRPDWLNMDKIMKVESEYDVKSTFFWLVNKDKVNARMTNSDYHIRSSSIQKIIQSIEEKGWENGLHKSISSDSFRTELNRLGVTVSGNRFHYLRFSLPEGYDEIEKSELKFDASLGFAESFGFRNSYGLPFMPYHLKEQKQYSFVEVPLNVMDGTFHRYMNLPVNQTAESVIRFVEKNKTDCILSILWHNTFFTNYKYKGYLEEYKKLLAYFYENNIKSVNMNEIIDEYAQQ